MLACKNFVQSIIQSGVLVYANTDKIKLLVMETKKYNILFISAGSIQLLNLCMKVM